MTVSFNQTDLWQDAPLADPAIIRAVEGLISRKTFEFLADLFLCDHDVRKYAEAALQRASAPDVFPDLAEIAIALKELVEAPPDWLCRDPEEKHSGVIRGAIFEGLGRRWVQDLHPGLSYTFNCTVSLHGRTLCRRQTVDFAVLDEASVAVGECKVSVKGFADDAAFRTLQEILDALGSAGIAAAAYALSLSRQSQMEKERESQESSGVQLIDYDKIKAWVKSRKRAS